MTAFVQWHGEYRSAWAGFLQHGRVNEILAQLIFSCRIYCPTQPDNMSARPNMVTLALAWPGMWSWSPPESGFGPESESSFWGRLWLQVRRSIVYLTFALFCSLADFCSISVTMKILLAHYRTLLCTFHQKNLGFLSIHPEIHNQYIIHDILVSESESEI